MTDEFDAKMQGCVGRGYLAEIKFLKRTLRWHEPEMCFGDTRYATEHAVLLALTDIRAVVKTRTSGTNGGLPRRSPCAVQGYSASMDRWQACERRVRRSRVVTDAVSESGRLW